MSTDLLTCSCCGTGVYDTPEHNVSHGEVPYPHDQGFGMCVKCGGDKRETGTTAPKLRKRMGWAGQTFFDARIEVLRKRLTGANLEKFNTMSFERKVVVITKMVERGMLT